MSDASGPRDRRAGRPARILLVNPNTNAATTEMMRRVATASLDPATPATLRAVTVDRGPAMIVEPGALAAAADAVRETVLETVRETVRSPGWDADAVVVGAVGDPGRAALAAELAVPVVGIGQAAVLEAARHGRRFAMVTTTPALVATLTGLVEHHGCSAGFLGVFLTRGGPLALAADPGEQDRQVHAAADAAVTAGAEAVIVAGGPLSGTAGRLGATTGIPVVGPVPAAMALTQRLLTRR